MASGGYGPVLRQVGRLLGGGGTASALGEGQLLRRFAADRDEAAFEALVGRHGPMVLGTCRRMLADPHDVDDAFQATFLVLARRAGSIRDGDRLGPWLHGVARRVAGRSRANSARRQARERPGGEDHAVSPADPHEALELRSAMDEELARLPEKYRAPLVLCYLEGLTHDEAADRLGWPVGTVRSRMAGGRDRLRARLSRRGLAPSAAVPAVLPVAAVPEVLISSTVRIATAAGTVPAHVASLAKGALIAMIWHKFKAIAALGLLAGLAAGGVGLAAQRGGDAGALDPPPAQKPAGPPAARPEDLRRELDTARKEIQRLEAELLAARTAAVQLREQADAARAGVPFPPTAEVAPGPGPGRAEGAGRPTTPGVLAAPPTVLDLPTTPPLFAVIPGSRDRVTIIDQQTRARDTFRLAGEVAEVETLPAGGLVALRLKGRDLARVGVYSVKDRRWSGQDLGPGTTEVHPYLMGNYPIVAPEVTASEIRRLSVFDSTNGSWASQDLREPARGKLTPALSRFAASYRVGRFIYTYSSPAKKWTVLELNQASPPVDPAAPAVDGSDRMVVPDGDLIHLFDVQTGEWTHLDTKDPQ